MLFFSKKNKKEDLTDNTIDKLFKMGNAIAVFYVSMEFKVKSSVWKIPVLIYLKLFL